MAGANGRHGPHANAEHNRDADQDDGSHDGRLGGAAEIAEPEVRLAVGNAAKTEPLPRRQLAWQLARRRRLPDGSDQPHAVLDAGRGAVAEILDRYDGELDQ